MSQFVATFAPEGPQYPAILTSKPWWLQWWPAKNVVFGQHIFDGGGDQQMNFPTFRHELTHVKQYKDRGWLWVWTHPTEREAEAHAAENAEWPQWKPA